jgi:hypothetical protein
MTVFAGSPPEPLTVGHDLMSGFPDSTIAMQSRIDEDRTALEAFGNRAIRLDLLDFGYTEGARSPEDTEVLRSAVEAWITEDSYAKETCILIPVGAGQLVGGDHFNGNATKRSLKQRAIASFKDFLGIFGARWVAHQLFLRRKSLGRMHRMLPHPDHLFVRDTVMSMNLISDRLAVVLYEDFPYLWSGRGDSRAGEIKSRLGLSCSVQIAPVEQQAKFDRIMLYKSQVQHLDPVERRLSDPITIPDHERFWLLSSREG